jgi:hypothetical protein
MNPQLEAFARQSLKTGLEQCTPEQQHLFRRMHSHHDVKKPINQVVDDMPADRLDGALTQVNRTIEQNQKPPR